VAVAKADGHVGPDEMPRDQFDMPLSFVSSLRVQLVNNPARKIRSDVIDVLGGGAGGNQGVVKCVQKSPSNSPLCWCEPCVPLNHRRSPDIDVATAVGRSRSVLFLTVMYRSSALMPSR